MENGKTESFFRRVDWSAFWTATLVSFFVYFYTLAPTVTLEDSGELATASAYLGVPHPPGYPIWTIITWIFTKLFAFVTYRGQPNPAWSVGLVSAVFGALASGFTAILLCRSGTDLLRGLKKTTEVIGRRVEDLICWVGGVSGSLVFAFTPVEWSQSVINEVYSLNAFFLMLVLFLAYVWIRRPREPIPYVKLLVLLFAVVSYLAMLALTIWHVMHFNDFWEVGVHYVLSMLLLGLVLGGMYYAWRNNFEHRILYVTAFVFGLGLTNYQVLLLLIASLVLLILLKDLKMFRDFLICAAPYLVGYLLVTKNVLPAISHPATGVCYTYVILNFVWLAAVYLVLPNGKAVAPTVVCVELGLWVYEFMSLASETNPPMNWGYPRTWEGFQHAISRGQYEKITPTSIFTKEFLDQIGDYLRDLRGTFTLPIVVLGFLPFTAWGVTVNGRRYRALSASVGMAIVAVAFVLIEEVFAPHLGEIRALSFLYRSLIGVIIAMAAIGGVVLLVEEAVDFFQRLMGDDVKEEGWRWSVLGLEIDRDSRKWTVVTFLAFLVMSFVLISLAAPKGDIQDAFIQRVKFISSHALYALWIGYGLMFGLSFVDAVMKGNRLVSVGGFLLACAIPLIPIADNAYNKELVRISGGAEQQGHDYGWQFGNYQLRGAEAIDEEISPTEEPAPNPLFPKDMGTNAVFFGGTDPGRFVPTYMIYGANVRPDVFLITQNALADNTYMNVMRDLYGDLIWIPAQNDSSRAFQRYVEEVNSGKRPRNADLKIENGRVQVSGVMGVMEINGILAQMIFEHNNYRHDFYVEESYVIRWMYPYLTPHGLIMKINRDMVMLDEATVRDDQDFWDWYTRSLVGEEKFRRDVVARKSFSKLRSAIGGLYSSRGRFDDAERAFQQSRMLYPLSPEANFRLVQEVLMPQRRFGEASAVIAEFGKMDPGNKTVPGVLSQITGLGSIDVRIRELEQRGKDGKMDVQSALQLASLYMQANLQGPFAAVMNGILSTPGLPPPFYLDAAELLQRGGRIPDMVRALDLCTNKLPAEVPAEVYLRLAMLYEAGAKPDGAANYNSLYLRQRPNDWERWIMLAAQQVQVGRHEEAMKALDMAARFGGNQAIMRINQNPAFGGLRRAGPQKNLLGIPGLVPEDTGIR